MHKNECILAGCIVAKKKYCSSKFWPDLLTVLWQNGQKFGLSSLCFFLTELLAIIDFCFAEFWLNSFVLFFFFFWYFWQNSSLILLDLPHFPV